MNTPAQKAPVEVHSIGEAAADVLSVAEQGTVIASVTGAAYLHNQHGEICWLIPLDAPMHQRGIKTVGQIPRLRTGSRYQVADHHLVIDSTTRLDLRHSQTWIEPSVPVDGIISISALSGSLRYIADQLLNMCDPYGFGCLIQPILQLATQQENVLTPCFENKIAEKAWPEVKGMIRARRERDDEQFFHHAKSLVGLGQGLTPSGDDLLGGFFFSMKLQKTCYAQIVTLPAYNHSDLNLQWSPLTSWLSCSILLDNIDGHSVEPMHHFAAGILTGAPADRLLSHARTLLSLGHSTGWDMLAGFIAGMSTVIGQ
jgi:Protein of unknown function (DUF2877)